MNQRISYTDQKPAKADAGPSLVASRLVLKVVLDDLLGSRIVLCWCESRDSSRIEAVVSYLLTDFLSVTLFSKRRENAALVFPMV